MELVRKPFTPSGSFQIYFLRFLTLKFTYTLFVETVYLSSGAKTFVEF